MVCVAILSIDGTVQRCALRSIERMIRQEYWVQEQAGLSRLSRRFYPVLQENNRPDLQR
jgi:hypothetical protein